MEASELVKYFRGDKRHPFYVKSVEQATNIGVHAKGMYPSKLIDERRPSESEFIRAYRKQIWEPITQEPITQVESELMKIRKADDWSINYKSAKVSPSIKQGESLEDYCEKKFPKGFTSVTNWTFSVLLDCYLTDAAGLFLVIPLERVEKTEYRRPFPSWFPSVSVLEYTDEIAILSNSREELNATEKSVPNIFYVADKMQVVKYVEAKEGNYEISDTIVHNLGYVPLISARGIFRDSKEGYILWGSRIACMVPRLNEAAREYSDLQAEVVQHIHSEKWVIATQNCMSCKGTGKVRQGNPIEILDCPQCSGSGSIATSPYSTLLVQPPKPGQNAVIPPTAYITKPVEIVKIQDERIDKHIYKALCSLNMQYLDKIPLVESGYSKMVDKESLNNFVHSVAEDIVAFMDRLYRMINDYRYKDIVEDEKDRAEMLPSINVPSKLDIISASYLVDEVKKLKDGGINPIIINATEVELANKKFNDNNDIRNMLQCVYELDPLTGISQEDKMSMLQNKGITHEDYVISCNIQYLIKQALLTDNNFFKIPTLKKQEKIKELAASILENTQPVKINIEQPRDPAIA